MMLIFINYARTSSYSRKYACPMLNPGTPPPPHVGGPVSGPGVPTVLIDGKPAAVMGDMCVCASPPDTDYLDGDDYSDYPELKQKIDYHLKLKKLRCEYFHISHECSFTGELVSIFDPHGKSIRDKPSRS